MDTRVFKYLWGLPAIADCKHCGQSTKVFRHFRNRPFDAWYLCKIGNDKTDCGGAEQVVEIAPQIIAPKRLEDVVAKRGSDVVNQDEIDAMVEAANK